MKFIKRGNLSELENDVFRAKGVLYANDLPKVLWCELPEAGQDFKIKTIDNDVIAFAYDTETNEECNYVTVTYTIAEGKEGLTNILGHDSAYTETALPSYAFNVNNIALMYVDGEPKKPSLQYEFTTAGEHIIKFVMASEYTDLGFMFNGGEKFLIPATSIVFSPNFDTSKVTNMQCMFFACNKLTELDVSMFDTSKVTNMYGIFKKVSGLTNLDLSNWDFSSVRNLTYFAPDNSWKTINVEGSDSNLSIPTLHLLGANFGYNKNLVEARFDNILDDIYFYDGIIPAIRLDFLLCPESPNLKKISYNNVEYSNELDINYGKSAYAINPITNEKDKICDLPLHKSTFLYFPDYIEYISEGVAYIGGSIVYGHPENQHIEEVTIGGPSLKYVGREAINFHYTKPKFIYNSTIEDFKKIKFEWAALAWANKVYCTDGVVAVDNNGFVRVIPEEELV